ncbi:MAG: CDP-alcohol phosphatidyltransferase family protein [Blastocatellia bacterium AA13]|nr:MAG: CDP-alcohol phosphatidyltransferase family protein [Blastocatellia bacterium AA13]
MISEAIAIACRRVMNAVVRALARSRINPNALTFIGLVMNIGCAFLYGYGRFFLAGLLMILANLFDMLDGRVARLRGRVTQFGAFFDSVIDRYSDIVVFVGIMVFYASPGADHSPLRVALTGIALVGSVMISYSRARAESLDIACKVGFLERPERVVLLIIGSLTEIGPQSNPFLHKMPQVLWALAVLSHWTVVHRIYHTWGEMREPDKAAVKAQASRANSQSGETLVRADYSVQNQ